MIASLIFADGQITRSLYNGSRDLVCTVGDWRGVESADIERIIQESSRARIVNIEQNDLRFQLVINIVEPRISLLILGAGHVGQAIAVNASLLGYNITVIDDRAEFLSLDRFSGLDIKLRFGSFDKLDLSGFKPMRTAVAIVTRGHQYDEQCLRAFLNYDLEYIGMIGSKRRVVSIFEKLIKDGFNTERIHRVRAPIGLKIGARSPQEIAVSVLAEIIQTMNAPSNN